MVGQGDPINSWLVLGCGGGSHRGSRAGLGRVVKGEGGMDDRIAQLHETLVTYHSSDLVIWLHVPDFGLVGWRVVSRRVQTTCVGYYVRLLATLSGDHADTLSLALGDFFDC